MDTQSLFLAFKGKLVGNKRMKHHVLEMVAKLPQNLQEFITENVWFVTSFDDAWAFTFTGDDFKSKHVIFLSEDLLTQNIVQIHWTIAHEIGHVVLGHKNRFYEKFGKDRVKKQEKEADKFAKQYTTPPRE